jgi:hypothetical protein
LHIECILLLNQTSSEIPLETSHNNSLRQSSYCTTNHPVILGNVCDPFFETLLMPNQDRRRISHAIWLVIDVVAQGLMCLRTHRCSVAGILQLPDLLHHLKYSLFLHIRVLLVKWKTLHLETFLFPFPWDIFSAQILTVHFIYLNLYCASQAKTAYVHIWQTSGPHSHTYYSVNKNILWTIHRIVFSVCCCTLCLKKAQVLLL